MQVKVKGQRVAITPEQVAVGSTTWFSANIIQGTLISGEEFHVITDPTRWSKFMAGDA